MSILVEETNTELERVAAENAAAGDWVSAIPSPLTDFVTPEGKLPTPGETLKHLYKDD